MNFRAEKNTAQLFVEEDTIVFLLEPFHGVSFRDSVFESNSRLLSAAVCDVVSRSGKHNVEIHSVDTDARIVLDAKIDMFSNTEAKVSGLRKVASFQLVFLHLQTLLQDFFSLGSSHSAMNSNLFVTSDTEGSDSKTSFGENRCLTSKCFQHFTSTHQSITTLTDTDVDAQFLDANLFHWVDLFNFFILCHFD